MSKESRLHELKKIVGTLEKIRGRHTELVSVYVPAGYSLVEIMNQLRQEAGTAQNIKSKATRKNVVTALEKIVQHLRIYKKTPDNGLAVFCGNVSEQEGAPDMRIWAIEPPEPLHNKLYWCDQQFVLDPLREMVKEKEIYGLITVDKSEACVAYLRGKRIELAKHLESIVPSKTSKGGWCVSGDTLAILPNGALKPMSKLKQDDDPVISYDFQNKKFVVAEFDAIMSRNVDEVYEIITEAPTMRLKTTKEHRLFVFDNGNIIEKSVGELKTGDRIISSKHIQISKNRDEIVFDPFDVHADYKLSKKGAFALAGRRKELGFSEDYVGRRLGLSQTIISKLELGERGLKKENLENLLSLYSINKEKFFKQYMEKTPALKFPSGITNELARFIGYAIGDGSKDGNRIKLYEERKDVIECYRKISEEMFGVNNQLRFRKGCYELKIYSKYLPQLIEKYFGILFDKASKRSVPEVIQRLDESRIRSFVGGVFDAEGYVDKSAGLVGIASSSLSLMRELQILLFRIGIVSSFYVKSPKGSFSKNEKYGLRITDKESLQKFHKTVGLTANDKMECLKGIIESATSFTRHCNLGNIMAVRIKKIEKTKSPGTELFYDLSVPKFNNFVANGIIIHNSQQRYARIREGLLNDFLKEVGDVASHVFKDNKELLGIIVGGPGPIKEMFVKGSYLQYEVQQKILGIIDISYTDESGLHELVERASDILAQAAVTKEKNVLQKFLSELRQESSAVAYGFGEVKNALDAGAVQTLLLSEDFDWVHAKLRCPSGHELEKDMKPQQKQLCPACKLLMREYESADLLDAIATEAEQRGAEVFIISTATREGVQLKELGGIAAMLRYRMGR